MEIKNLPIGTRVLIDISWLNGIENEAISGTVTAIGEWQCCDNTLNYWNGKYYNTPYVIVRYDSPFVVHGHVFRKEFYFNESLSRLTINNEP